MSVITELRPIIDRLACSYASVDLIDAVIAHMVEIGMPRATISAYLAQRSAEVLAAGEAIDAR